MCEKTFSILQDERILYIYIYIATILTQILFCFNAVVDFVGDIFMHRVEVLIVLIGLHLTI